MIEKFKILFLSSPLKRRFAHGVIWSAVGSGFAQMMVLISYIIIARILNKDAYGALGYLQQTVGLLGIFSGMGAGITLSRHLAQFRESDPARAGRIIAFCLSFSLCISALLTLLVLLLAKPIAYSLLNRPELAVELRWACLLLFSNAVFMILSAGMTGLEAFKSSAKVSFFMGVIQPPLMVLGVYWFELKGALMAQSLVTGLTALLTLYVFVQLCHKQRIHIIFRGCWREFYLLRYSFSAFLSGLFHSPVEWVIYTLLAQTTNGYSQLAYLTVARQWQTGAIFLGGKIGQVNLPILSSMFGNKNYHGCGKVLKKSTLLISGVTLIIVIPIAVASPYIMKAYGESYADAWPILVVVCLNCLFIAANTTMGNAIWAFGLHHWGVGLAALRSGLTIAVFYFFLLDYGALGAVLSITLVWAALTGFLFWLLGGKIRSLQERKKTRA